MSQFSSFIPTLESFEEQFDLTQIYEEKESYIDAEDNKMLLNLPIDTQRLTFFEEPALDLFLCPFHEEKDAF